MNSSSHHRISPMGKVSKVYCDCGAIVDLDRASTCLKHALGKKIECMGCRNMRIAADIDLLNQHFSGEQEEDPWLTV